MKTITNIIYLAFALFALAPATQAQCPQICGENSNTALGIGALLNTIPPAGDNTAIGTDALYTNTTGSENTAIGRSALQNNTTGHDNTAIGAEALATNTTGFDNTAFGENAMLGDPFGGSTGSNNTATGYEALFTYTTGFNNTATGYEALFSSKTANNNTANGFRALFSNTVGVRNTADGENALRNNTIGSSNVALGSKAGFNLTTGSNNIDSFDGGVAGESNTIRVGTVGTQTNAYVAGISGVTVANGVGVIIDTSGHLGTVVSSERFKDAVKPMDKVSEAILALKPVTFHYKRELDPDGIPQFGLVAEQVEKVDPDLVARDEQGKPYTVRYEAVNAMLFNEFLKEHKAFDAEQHTVASLQAVVAQQQRKLKRLPLAYKK